MLFTLKGRVVNLSVFMYSWMCYVLLPFDNLLPCQATIRERTQAVEKLAEAEAEAGRLHVRLSSVTATSEEIQASSSSRKRYFEDTHTFFVARMGGNCFRA